MRGTFAPVLPSCPCVPRTPRAKRVLAHALLARRNMELVKAVRRVSPTLPPDAPVNEWKVLRPIGRGGAATVYEAEHGRTGRRVAMKVVDIDLRQRADLRARFEREVRIMSSIDDPHVPEVIDFGELDNGAPYLVLERLEGETLQQRLDRASMSIREVFVVARELLSAVAAVHRYDVVHRDIKPANVFLHREPDGKMRIKLLDFGVCFPIRDSSGMQRITLDGLLVGTASYIAPELLRGEKPDGRADLYSVGAVLYECITGVPPHSGNTWSESVIRAIEEDPAPIKPFRRECPIALDRFVRLALERNPDRRFRSATEMQASLEDVLAGGVPVRPNECLYCVRSEPMIADVREGNRARLLTVAAFMLATAGTALGLLAF